jgi:hypothetical protein
LINQNNVIAKEKVLSLDVFYSIDSTVKVGNKLKTNNFLYSNNFGYVDLYLNPYRSTRVQIFQCTYFKVENLSRVRNGISLNLTYSNISFCPYKSSIKITSTYKDKDSKLKGKFKNREVSLYGTEIFISESIENEVLIGVEKGAISINYFGNKPKYVHPKQFIISKNNQAISDPLISPQPILESVGKFNGLNRVCTNRYNTLVSNLGKFPKLINDKKCIDTELTDKMFVINPSGKGTDQLWVFSGI